MHGWQNLSRLAAALGGLPILGCLAGSPSREAGIRYGDILLSIDDKPTPTWDDFLSARKEVKGRFVARIFRDGVEMAILIVLRPNPQSPLEVLAELMGGGLVPVEGGPEGERN
jgi:S1-C subfamily serine protease